MSRQQLNIILFFIGFLLPMSALAQVYIGDGVTIKENTTFHVVDQDIIIDTDKISGEGKITIESTENQKVVSLKNENILEKVAVLEPIRVNNSNEIKVATAQKIQPKKEIKKDLPVRYVNIEAESYVKENEEKVLCIEEDKDFSGGVLVVEAQRLQPFIVYEYIVPIIYYYTLNERFSDVAELYEFEYSTAILKPPIV